MLRPGTFALTALLAALTAIAPLSTDMYLPSLPDIARALSASTAQVQLTISAYLIGFAVGQIIYGPISDRHGRKPVLLAALALYSVATLICTLSPLDFGIAFALSAVGYLTGTNLATRFVMRLGLDRTIGFGCCALAAGGLGMVVSVALGFTSAFALVLPVAIYLAGMGMVLPQSVAGAMTPFPERAGAASALFGFVQQSIAAICGATVGALLGHNAWPLAGAVAIMGVATLSFWTATRGIRARAARPH